MAGSMAIGRYGMSGIYGLYGNMRPGGAAAETAGMQKNTGMQGNTSSPSNTTVQGSSASGRATKISGNATAQEKTAAKSSPNPDDQVKVGRKSSPSECKTCKERKYQDGSNESDVSFKAPGHISPQASAGTVRAHEMQHVSNAYEKAAKGDGKVVSATVTLRTEICPECGTSYVAGGETHTSIAYSAKENPYQKNKKALESMNQIGSNIDYVA